MFHDMFVHQSADLDVSETDSRQFFNITAIKLMNSSKPGFSTAQDLVYTLQKASSCKACACSVGLDLPEVVVVF